MYLEFYKLREMPFRLAPDPRFMYWSAGHAAALACMRSAQVRRNSCAVITGDRGTGKTTLLEYLLQREPPGSAVRIDFPPRSVKDLSEILLSRCPTNTPRAAQVIVCDNAHLLREEMLAAILAKTLLPGSQAHETRIVLTGEPALAQALDSPTIASIGKRQAERVDLRPLTAADVIAYIAHRLGMAGATEPHIFRDEICVEIYRETKGNPRLVNALCDAAMVVACERELTEVGPSEIRRALEDIGRLTVAQPGETEPAQACAPPIETPLEVSRPIVARLRLVYQGEVILERELSRGALRIGRGPDNEMQIGITAGS
jgi:general secretion pathway protein A